MVNGVGCRVNGAGSRVQGAECRGGQQLIKTQSFTG